MCRLALMNRKYIEKEGKKNIKAFLDQLEKSCGGHGNGVLFIKDGKIEANAKSLRLSNQLIVDVLFNDEYEMPDWFLYHTRVASKGSIKDENCHPYVNEENSFALMMNGTISSFGAFGNYMGDITDTEALFKMMNTFNVNLKVLTELDPRFIGFKDGKVFASNSSGSYSVLVFKEEDEALCIASESPDKKTWDKLESEYLWIEGEKVQKAKKVSYESYYKGYVGNYYKGGKWDIYDDEEYNYTKKDDKKTSTDCKVCTINDEPCLEVDDEENISIQEAFDVIEDFIYENQSMPWKELQNTINDFFGMNPILDGKLCTIMVFEDKTIMIEDQNGELFTA